MYSTITDALNAYSTCYPQKNAKVESAVRRYLLPILGFKISNARVTLFESEECNKFMARYPLNRLNRANLLNLLEDEFKRLNLTPQQKKSPRSLIRQFLDFINLTPKNEPINDIPDFEITLTKSRKTEKLFDKTSIQAEIKKNHKPHVSSITLSMNPQDYLDTYSYLYPELTEKNLLIIINKELFRIHNELDECANFLSTKQPEACNQKTLKSWFEKIYHLLGWSYQQTFNLSEIGLSKLIPVINTNCWNENYTIELERSASEAGKRVVAFLKAFFEDHEKTTTLVVNDVSSDKKLVKQTEKNNNYKINKGYKSSSKGVYISCLIRVAKYLYKDITDDCEANDYEDIRIIRQLRVFRNKLSKDNTKKIQKIPITYPELKTILLHLKAEADAVYTTCGNKRNDKYIANDLQKFIAFCFLVVVPPIRRRTLCELQWGLTLKYGNFDRDGYFTAHNDLKDDKEAKYYYHFQPDDYKTGKIYGEFIAVLPNTTFPDGTTFYDYLHKWLFEGWRERLQVNGQTHSYIFMYQRSSKTASAGDPLSESIFGSLIAYQTYRYTGCQVFPHKFRHIRRSYLKEIGATAEELESFAFFMQHSKEMAEKTYTILNVEQKLSPCLNFLKNEKF